MKQQIMKTALRVLVVIILASLAFLPLSKAQSVINFQYASDVTHVEEGVWDVIAGDLIGRKVQLIGWTCPIGDEEMNLILAENRCIAVAAELVKRGISASQIEFIVMGEDHLSGLPYEQRRRVDVHIVWNESTHNPTNLNVGSDELTMEEWEDINNGGTGTAVGGYEFGNSGSVATLDSVANHDVLAATFNDLLEEHMSISDAALVSETPAVITRIDTVYIDRIDTITLDPMSMSFSPCDCEDMNDQELWSKYMGLRRDIRAESDVFKKRVLIACRIAIGEKVRSSHRENGRLTKSEVTRPNVKVNHSRSGLRKAKAKLFWRKVRKFFLSIGACRRAH